MSVLFIRVKPYKLITQYRARQNLVGKNLANCKLFAKNFLTNIHRCMQNVCPYMAYALTSLFAKFFLVNSFYLHAGSPNFPQPNVSRVR